MSKATPARDKAALDFHMRIYQETWRKLDSLRKKEEDFPSRAEMIRRLVDRAK
jgi:hypothetical protein